MIKELIEKLILSIEALTFYEWTGLAINASMLLVTVVSAVCAFAAYFHQKNRGKKDEACKLAKHYSDVILEKYSFIASVYIRAGLDVKIKNVVDFAKLHYFDRMELEIFLQAKSINYDEFINKLNQVDAIAILKCIMLLTDEAQDPRSTIGKVADRYETTNIINAEDEAFLQKYFRQYIFDFLNDLEWFCMTCRYGLADEEILYQSLQKTFLSATWLCAPIICNANSNDSDKIYTNVIWLFTEWRRRLKRISKKTNRRKRILIKKIERTQKKIREDVFSGKKLH